MRLKKHFLRLTDYVRNNKLILLVVLGYTVIILTVLLNRFWQYEVFYYDHGMMEGNAYQISQFQPPLHHRDYGKITIYIDHFSPSMQVVLAPFYWVWDSYETPIIIMSVLIGLSVLFGYEIARSLIKNKFMIYALLFAYMFYVGMQNALIFFIHDITLQIPFLMFLCWSIVKKRVRLFYLLLLLNLGFKESVAVTGLALGFSMLFFLGPFWRKHGIVTMLISIAYGYFVSKHLIPYFRYINLLGTTSFGYSPDPAQHWFDYIIWLFDNQQKRETILTSLSTFGFLPVFSIFSWPLMAQDFLQRFSLLQHGSNPRMGLNLFYHANLAVILFVGSAYATSFLERFSIYRKIIYFHAIMIVLLTSYYHQFVYHGPLGLIYNRDFLKITKNLKFMDDFVKKIPTRGKVMTQNNLAAHLTHTDLYILLNEDIFDSIDPDVLAIDFSPGQNPNNFFPLHEPELKALAERLMKHPRYKVIYQETYRYIFVKKSFYNKKS
jgi:uncharacterized membrane protein